MFETFEEKLSFPDKPDELYRVVASGTTPLMLDLEIYPIIRMTLKSYVIHSWELHHPKGRYVLKGNGKRFAHKTKRWALESFIRRNYWRTKRLHAQLEAAKTAGQLAAEAIANFPETAND